MQKTVIGAFDSYAAAQSVVRDLAAGPIVAALTGAGMGAVAGGLLGVLTDLGVSEEHARYYTEALRRGGALVALRCDASRSERAEEIMRAHGAIDIVQRVLLWQRGGWRTDFLDARRKTADRDDR